MRPFERYEPRPPKPLSARAMADAGGVREAFDVIDFHGLVLLRADRVRMDA